VLRLPVQRLTARVDYTYVTPVMGLAHRFEAFIDATEYAEAVTFTLLVPLAAVEAITRQMTDLTNGTATLTHGPRTVRSV